MISRRCCCGGYLSIGSESVHPLAFSYAGGKLGAVRPAMWAAIAGALACVGIAWAGASLIAFPLFVAASLEDLRVLLRRAVRVSAPAMWFAPAALFLSAWSPLRATVGVLLVANTVRLLVSRVARTVMRDRTRHRTTRLFRYSTVPTAVLSSDAMPVIAGAFALQCGVVAVLARSSYVAAVLVGLGTAAWTLSSVRRSAYEPAKQQGALRTVVSVLLTFLLSMGLSVPVLNQRGVLSAKQQPGPAGSDRVLPLDIPGHSNVSRAIPRVLLSGKEFVPGVVLIPAAKTPRQPRIRLLPSRLGISGTHSLTFPFTGEYQLFPASSGRIQPGSVVYTGTPLDAIYVTLGGGPLETCGFQKLNPPIDLSNCGRIQMTIVSGERSPASAVLQLMHDGGVLNLGSDVFGFERSPEETLTFSVPQTARLLVHAIRVAFYRDPTHRDESTRVAIERFTLVPRAL